VLQHIDDAQIAELEIPTGSPTDQDDNELNAQAELLGRPLAAAGGAEAVARQAG